MLKNKSKIGKLPIRCPASVSCKLENNLMQITGPKGSCSFNWCNDLSFKHEDNLIKIEPKNDSKDVSAIWGTMRSILNNFISGVQDEHKNNAKLLHVGYKAREFTADNKEMIEFTLGKSTKKIPPVDKKSHLYDAISKASDKGVYQQDYLTKEVFPGATIKVIKPTELLVESVDKALLGAAIAKIKKLRSEKFYKGRRISAGGDFVIKRAVKQTK